MNKQKEPLAVWIIILIVITLIAALIVFDARILAAHKVSPKGGQDSIGNSRGNYPDSALDEDTIFVEDPADSNRGELKREYLKDGGR